MGDVWNFAKSQGEHFRLIASIDGFHQQLPSEGDGWSLRTCTVRVCTAMCNVEYSSKGNGHGITSMMVAKQCAIRVEYDNVIHPL